MTRQKYMIFPSGRSIDREKDETGKVEGGMKDEPDANLSRWTWVGNGVKTERRASSPPSVGLETWPLPAAPTQSII